LYRRAKIQEAVLETLTREYEMAKVQEAKEIPTVKILDPPQIPDKRAYPPRLLIIFLGTASTMAVAISLIFAKNGWEHTDVLDEKKIFAQEVFGTLNRKPAVSTARRSR
jgi:uncharacterized protein involved in exopolysaccharide biosynthesis